MTAAGTIDQEVFDAHEAHEPGFNSRVGLVGPLPPPAGGMANQTQQLAELLRAAGASVVLVQTNSPYKPDWIATVPVVRALFRLLAYVVTLWKMAGEVDVMHVMANSGWSWHLFAAPAIWIARLRRVPVVVNYRGGEAEEFLARAQTSVRFSMRQASALIVPSGFLKEIFERFGMPAKIVPNIIDLARFHPRPDATPKKNGKALHFVVARNLEPLYDNETALRAFRLLLVEYRDARLTIAGSGPDAALLKTLTTRLGIDDRVAFPGRLDREQMAALYREADVVVNPSLADNMPNSVLEAMASGVPVVSTNVGGVPFIVEDEITALLVSPGSPAQTADAMLRLAGKPSLRRQLASAGLAEVERYTWPRVAPLLADIYRSAMAGTRS